MNPYFTISEDAMDAEDSSSLATTNNEAQHSGMNTNDGNNNNSNAWSLLAMARQLIAQGKPSYALQMILEANRAQGGETAVMQTLQRARNLYRNKIQENAAADELASLFAECAIAESQQIETDLSRPLLQIPPALNLANDTSILAMSGRKQIMLDSFSDGSSFICLSCGGLVSSGRKDEHSAYWCS